MISKLFTFWTSHLKTKEEREAFEKIIKNTDKRVLDAIDKQLRNSLEQIVLDEGLSGYDSPSWAYRQAHLNGYREGLNRALFLILDLKGERY